MRRATTAAFAVALFAFVLPFATVSCDESSVEPTGADLVLRSTPETEGERSAESLELPLGELVVAYGGGLATAAFLAFALALWSAARRWPGAWAAVAGVVGVAALVFLKTRGGGTTEGIAEVDAQVGGVLAVVAGGLGALGAGAAWLQRGLPAARPLAPVLALVLLLFGYLFPSERGPVASVAYADTLDLRNPWDGAFWALPVIVGVLLLARRRDVSRRLAGFAVGVLAVASADVAHEIWTLWREDDLQPGVAPLAFLAGMVLAGGWVAAYEWRQLRRPAALPLAAGVILTLVLWLASPANA
jgi:hypothetical protein